MTHPIFPGMLSVAAAALSDEEKHLLEKINPVGVSLFARNISSPQQLCRLTREIKETIGRPDVLIAVDQEGGRVRRLTEPYFPSYAGQQTLGRLYTEISAETARRAASLQAALIAADLHRCGINLNYAPVLDLLHPETAAVLASRCFSDNPQITAELGTVMAQKYLDEGIIPCIKHFPGHGRAQTDPHLGLPRIEASLNELETDFFPFRQLHRLPCGMTAHIILSVIDAQRPVTQSPDAIKTLIRGLIGFDGFLISDALDMHALKGSLVEKTQTALRAGCDCICYCGGKTKDLYDLSQISLSLSDEALARLEKLSSVLNAAPRPAPAPETAAEYNRLVGQIAPYRETYDATEVLNQMNQGEN